MTHPDHGFYAWALERGRAHRLTQKDYAFITEELELIGKKERRELVSRLKITLLHLLKWQSPPEF